MTGHRFLILLFILPLTLSSCAIFPGRHGYELKGKERREIEPHADTIVREILIGINSGDHDMFSNHFDPDMRVHLSRNFFKEKREKILEKLGKYESYDLTGIYSHGPYYPAVYKVEFEKGEMTMKIIMSPAMEGYEVSGLEMKSGKTRF